jgi:hypothetical protein
MVRLRSSTRYTGACFVVGEAKPPCGGRDFVEVAGDVTIVMVLRECMMGGQDSAIGVEIGKPIRDVADEWIASGWSCGVPWTPLVGRDPLLDDGWRSQSKLPVLTRTTFLVNDYHDTCDKQCRYTSSRSFEEEHGGRSKLIE